MAAARLEVQAGQAAFGQGPRIDTEPGQAGRGDRPTGASAAHSAAPRALSARCRASGARSGQAARRRVPADPGRRGARPRRAPAGAPVRRPRPGTRCRPECFRCRHRPPRAAVRSCRQAAASSGVISSVVPPSDRVEVGRRAQCKRRLPAQLPAGQAQHELGEFQPLGRAGKPRLELPWQPWCRREPGRDLATPRIDRQHAIGRVATSGQTHLA